MQELVKRKKRPITLARRVETLENEIADLKQLVAQTAAKAKPSKDWRRTLGAFADDPTYDEALRLGRKWRQRQPKC